MSKFNYEINSPYMRPWIERVGKLILNFSAIEFESIHWYVQLSEREFQVKSIVEIPFTSRVTQIMGHIEERRISDKWRKQSLRRWNEALKLAHLRNQVAHNPIVFGWNDVQEAGDPSVLGIPDIRAKSSGTAKWLLSADHLDKSINSVAKTATALAALRVEWCMARDQGNAPPARFKPTLWYRLKRRIGMAFYAANMRRDGKQNW